MHKDSLSIAQCWKMLQKEAFGCIEYSNYTIWYAAHWPRDINGVAVPDAVDHAAVDFIPEKQPGRLAIRVEREATIDLFGAAARRGAEDIG